MPQLLEHGLEPLTVAAGLNADDHFTSELRVEAADIVEGLVGELSLMDLAVVRVTPHDELLSGVKIYAAMNSHSDSPFLTSKLATSLLPAARESHPLHHIRSQTCRLAFLISSRAHFVLVG